MSKNIGFSCFNPLQDKHGISSVLPFVAPEEIAIFQKKWTCHYFINTEYNV